MKNEPIGKPKNEPLNIGKERIELTDKYLREKAIKALKKAKELEKQKIANGAVWVKSDNRSTVLKNK